MPKEWMSKSYALECDKNPRQQLVVAETNDRFHIAFRINGRSVFLRKEKWEELLGLRWEMEVNEYNLPQTIDAVSHSEEDQ